MPEPGAGRSGHFCAFFLSEHGASIDLDPCLGDNIRLAVFILANQSHAFVFV